VPRSPPWTDMHLIWHSRRGRRRDHLWQIFWWSVEGCRFCGRSKIALSHWQSQWPLTQGWRYRAACEKFSWHILSRGRMHDAVLSVSPRLKSIYDGLAYGPCRMIIGTRMRCIEWCYFWYLEWPLSSHTTPFSIFCITSRIFIVGGVRYFKFGRQVDRSKY